MIDIKNIEAHLDYLLSITVIMTSFQFSPVKIMKTVTIDFTFINRLIKFNGMVCQIPSGTEANVTPDGVKSTRITAVKRR